MNQEQGQSDRRIGWSETAGFLVTVITVTEGATVWGANAWKSNHSDHRHYQDQALPAADNENTEKNDDVSKKEAL